MKLSDPTTYKDFNDELMRVECREPQVAEELAHAGLVLLKSVSSRKRWTQYIFDKYTSCVFPSISKA